MQQGAIAKGDVLQRLAGIMFVVGGILTLVFNFLYPRASDPTFDNVQLTLQAIADKGSTFYRVDNLLLAVGLWGLMIGWVGVYRSLSSGSAAVWARLGFYGVIVGTTLWTVVFGMNMGFGLVVEQWASSAEPAKATWLVVASALTRLQFLLFSMTVIVYWLATAFIGIGIVLGAVFPKWLGWVLVILGVVTVVVVGLPQVLAGPSQVVSNVLFPILATLSTLWAVATGIWVLRKAW
ncbi:MAG: hypothetical protein HY686_06260 [Chloroflexi bacterium]|nr:hypothetical protein [Chloroflexota bacterium]